MKIRILGSVLVLVLAAVAADAFAQAEAKKSFGGLLGGKSSPAAAARDIRPGVVRPNARNAGTRASGASARPLAPAGMSSAAANGEAKAELAEGEAPPLAWDNAPVDLVLQAYGEQIDKTILKDPKVNAQTTISLKSREGQKLTKEEYLEAIEVILEMNDIHLEPYGEKFIRAIPRAKARKEGIPLQLDPESRLKDSGRVVSMMIQFKNIGIEDAQKVLDNFKSDSSSLICLERTNSILVTDTEQNINRMVEIARAIDVATPVLENVYVRQIKYAAAADIQAVLQKIVEDALKEQEKNKGAQNAQNQQPRPGMGGGLLTRRPPQQQQPVVNQSVLLTVSDADRGMIRGKVLIVADERVNKLVIITQKSNMDFFDRVIADLDQETTPDTVVKVYRLKYAEAEEVSDMINDLIGNAPSSKGTTKGNQNQNAKKGANSNLTRTTPGAQTKSANQRTGEAKAGELSKENTTVLADKRINGLVVMTNKELVPVVESIIESMDVKLAQVLIETCIVEVTLGDEIHTGIDWVMKGRKDANGNDTLMQAGQAVGGGGGGNADKLFAMVASNAVAGAVAAINPTGSGINYLINSDALNLAAIIQASKTDSRANYLASPIIMTVDNKEATIEATESRKFYSGSTASSSYGTYGTTTYNYSDKDVGIKIKVTPKINPNGTVMLEVEEEYSQLGNGQDVLVGGSAGGATHETIDTALSRKMSADVLLDNNQTVVLGGLVEKRVQEDQTGIPILKDIPWIGKWLFGKVSTKEARKELLVFMTPYVLNDGEEAQVEALRRKKALSDSHPWEDHGWSASALADTVSKKEQLRRLKDEWKKQDEERKTKLAIEEAKLERVKELEKMSKEEREFWLEKHKEELEEEQKEKLEEQMQDEKSQSMLRKLAEEVRERKLAEAKADLEKAKADQKAEEKRDADKAKAELKAEAEEVKAKEASAANEASK